MKNIKLSHIVVGVVLFFASLGVSFGVTKAVLSTGSEITSPSPITSNTPSPAGRSKIDPSIPRTEICPLNGAKFTRQEKDVWSTRRPLAVMIENSVDARPQSGLSTADIVYEAVAEGGITRFMAMYYCNAALAGNITLAPVRSARIYFVNLMSEYDALYNHVGGAGNCDDVNVDPKAKALCVISRNNIKDLDQMGRAGDFKTCHRLANRLNREVAYEHTMGCFLEELYKAGAKWKWTNVDEKGVAWDKNFVSWKFKDATDKASGSSAKTISYMFWESNRDFNGKFDVRWDYDAASNSYKRSNGGEVSVDLNTNEPLMFNTVIVEFAKETDLRDLEKHMLYDVIGTGKAMVFMDGVKVDATWTKATRTARTIYRDSAGKEIKFNTGPMWISIIPLGNTVAYQ